MLLKMAAALTAAGGGTGVSASSLMGRGIGGAGSPGGGSGAGWSKWQIAAAVCVPVAVGSLGYWYYKKGHRCLFPKADGGKPEAGDAPSFDEGTDQGRNQGEEEEEEEREEEAQDPITRAQNAKNKGNKYFKGGKYAAAIKCYDNAINLCPKDNTMDLSTFYQNRAAAYEQMGKYEEVKDDCTQALDLNPRYMKALFRRAKALEQLRELSGSLEDITAVCILDGFQNQAYLMMADRVLKDLGRSKAKEELAKKEPAMPARHFVRTYFSSFSTGPLRMAALEAQGDGAGEGLTGGLAEAKRALRQERYEEVVPCCTREVEQGGSGLGEALLLRGTFYLLRGEHTKGLKDMESIIESDSPVMTNEIKVNALVKRASLYIQLEDPERCLADFNHAAEMSPDNPDIYHHRGQVYLLLDQLDKAHEDLETAARLNPDFKLAQVQKIYTSYRQALAARDGPGVSAVCGQFENFIKENPNCSEGYSLYAQMQTDQQNFQEADKLYQKAIKTDPGNATLIVHRAMLKLQMMQDVEEVKSLVNEAIKVDDRSEFAYETLGTIEVQQGHLKEAVQLFEKAIRLAKTEVEMAHLLSLRDAAKAQIKVAKNLDIKTMDVNQ